MNEILDIHYIDKVLGGDKNAFSYFIKEYQQMGYSIAISIVKNKLDAEDVVQNGFVQAYKRLHTFKKEAKFSTWLYRIIVNESLKHNLKSKKKATYKTSELINDKHGKTDNLAIENLSKLDRLNIINGAFLKMKPKEALVLKLHYLHELSIKEIEDTTGFSNSNIKILLYRARKSFKRLLNIDKTDLT